ncbi:MAG: nitroreductase family protein [Acholeplasmataceae bacterium]
MNVFTERKSIRNYDANEKISKETLTLILEETLRAPSSMNMQPTRLVVIESDTYKEKLKPVLFGNQLQLETSSHMICLFTDLKKYEYAEKIYTTAYEQGIMPKDVMERQIRNITNMIDDLDLKQVERTGVFDGGLFAMQLMLVAKSHGYDTCPIGGFRHDMLAEVLDLDKDRYKPLLIISIGKANESGWASIRLPLEDIVTYK